MFKRFSNRQLLIVLAVIGGLYLLSLAFGGRKESSFDKTLVSLDTAKVDQLIMYPAGKAGSVRLQKSGAQWMVQTEDGNMVPTADGVVKSALDQIAFLEASQLVSRDPDKWIDYQVTDSAGTRIEVMQGSEKVADLILGNFAMGQNAINSYVRLNGKDETYVVSGYLGASFARAADDWRNKSILKGSENEWASLSVTAADLDPWQIVKGNDNLWLLMPDSAETNTTAVTNYMNGLRNVSGAAFANRPPQTASVSYQLNIQSLNTGMIEVKAFSDAEHGFLVSSSQNPGAYFTDQDSSLVRKLFVDVASLRAE
ncbi:MAG: DUF4340 domain-containing protein [Bacteroidota bacterium]